MKIENSSPLLLEIQTAQTALTEANTAPLVADDYRLACTFPRNGVHQADAASMGSSRCLRRARRSFAEGRNAVGAAYSAALPFSVTAMAVTTIFYGLGPVLGYASSTLLEKHGKLKRTDRGVREDKVWRAVLAMTAAVQKAMAPEVKFALRTGELSLDALKAMSAEARACCLEARAASERWPEGVPHEGLMQVLARLTHNLDLLDKKLAGWELKLKASAA